MKEKILFVVPTLYEKHRQQIISETINNLVHSCEDNFRGSYRIVVVCNEYNLDFMNWTTNNVQVIKKFSNVRYGIAKSINLGIAELADEKYVCVHHDDIQIRTRNWIDKFISLYRRDSMRCGILGIRGHTDSFVENISKEVEEHSFTDGVMFFSAENARYIGGFCESYLGDCESQDYCYSMLASGLKNYLVNVDFNHSHLRFEEKSSHSRDEYLGLVAASRALLIKRWGKQVTREMLNSFYKSTPSSLLDEAKNSLR